LINVSQFDSSCLFSAETIEVLQHASGFINWKDREGCFLGCNFNFATLANLKSPGLIIGKQDIDFSWGQEPYALTLKMEDDLVLNGSIIYVLGQYPYGVEQKVVLIKKMPILNKNQEVVGILNALTTFCPENILSIIRAFQQHKIDLSLGLLDAIKQLFFSHSELLSSREEECAYFVLRGLTAKEMAKEMDLSYRTVEAHLTHLKEKLQCKKMSTLIVRLIELGFLDNIPSHLLLNK
jgi:DNA-binding CsgD family transcriptional regulator